jgi:alpha-L-fucosidase 2
MLLQSQNGELHLLPALPDAWKEGKVRGMVGRGNHVVDIDWKEGHLTSARITARLGGRCAIRTPVPVIVEGLGLRSRPGKIGHTLTFNAKQGRTYLVRPTS